MTSKTRKINSKLIFIVLMLLLFVSISIYASFNSSAYAAKAANNPGLEFTVSAGGYVPGTALRRRDGNLPVFELQFTRLTAEVLGQYGSLMTFEYAESQVVLNNLENNTLTWHALSKNGDAEEGFDINTLTAHLSVERLITKFVAISGNENAERYRRIIYFRAKQNETDPAASTSYFYNTSSTWDIYVNLTPGSKEETYAPIITPFGFAPGVTTFYKSLEDPGMGFDFKFRSASTQNEIDSLNLYFTLSDDRISSLNEPSIVWHNFNNYMAGNLAPGEKKLLLVKNNEAVDVLLFPNNLVKRYIYFKIEDPSDTNNIITHIPEVWFEIILEQNADASMIEIVDVQGTYNNGQEYPIYNQEGMKTWSNNGVNLSVKLSAGGESARVKGQFTNGPAAGKDVFFTYNNTTEKFELNLLQENLTFPNVGEISSYSGMFKIISYTTGQGGEEKIANIYVHIDKKQPIINLSAKTASGVHYGHNDPNAWAAENITFEIIDDEFTRPSSGVRFERLSENGWVGLQVQGDKRIYTAEKTEEILFRAVSGANQVTLLPTKARIDVKLPKLSLTAREGRNNNGKYILSADHDPTNDPIGNRRVGYAQDKVTFVLSNLTVQDQTANTITYKYKKTGESTYHIINKVDNRYVFEIETSTRSIIDIEYTFRIEAKTGKFDEKKFKLSILKSNYEVGMNIKFENVRRVDSLIGEKVSEDSQELIKWYSEKIPVNFTLPNNIAAKGASQYKVYSYIIGKRNTTTQLMNTIQDPNTQGVPTGKIRLLSHIDRNVRNEAFGFYVVDLAENEVNIDANSSVEMQTEKLYIDLEIPTANITRWINESNIQLAESDWSKGAVKVVIEIPANRIPKSGVICFPMFNENDESTSELAGKVISATNIITYSTVIETSGANYFMLRSGSGIGYKIRVDVHIDTTDIVLEHINAKTIDTNGNVIKEGIDIAGNEKVSKTTRIEFETNHAGHFNYEYIEFTNSGDPASPDSAATIIDNKIFFDILIPDGAEGIKKYGFKLISKAKDKNGHHSTSGDGYSVVMIKYDTRAYKIKAEYTSNPAVWSSDPYTISLETENQSNNIKIVGYKIKLDPQSVPANYPNNWIKINATPADDGTYSIAYTFRGVKWYVNEKERLDDIANNGLINLADASSTVTDSQKKYASYKGKIYFIAISESGKESDQVIVEVKQDTSSLSPLYALHQTSGEVQSLSNGVTAYSKNDFKYWAPEKNDPSKAHIFANKAPVTYSVAKLTGADQPAQDSTDWVAVNELASAKILDSSHEEFWIRAVRADHNGEVIRLSIKKQDPAKPLSIRFIEVENGNIGSQENIYIFEWVRRAGITVATKSTSDIYFWYKVGAGEWRKFFVDAKVPGTSYNELRHQLIFAGSPDDVSDAPEAVILNVKDTIRIKVTNRAGDESILNTIFTVKIDINMPTLDESNINLKTLSGTEITVTEAESEWYHEPIIITIDRNSLNPSGVDYSYRLEGQSEWIPIGNNVLNTDHIVAFPQKGGEATIILRADQKAHGLNKDFTIKVKIDKIIPEYTLFGIAYDIRNGSPIERSGELASGTWTNADEVRMFIRQKEGHVPISPAKFYRFDDAHQEWQVISDINAYISITNRVTFQVKCETEAGRTIEKVFQVNIDNIVPEITAGRFQNPAPPATPGDPIRYNEYYIDQKITYFDENIAKAEYNGYPLPFGHVIATNTIDNTVSYVHIIVVDMAGNKSELKFKMLPFPLTAAGDASAITLSEEHLNMLAEFERQFMAARSTGTLTESRDKYFEAQIARLKDRVSTMNKQITAYRAFLNEINRQQTFELTSDYKRMKENWDKFYSGDPLLEYPLWQQKKITEGIDVIFEKFKVEFKKLQDKMKVVRDVEKAVVFLPAMNVVEAEDYSDILSVYANYIELSKDQKAVFNPNIKNKIVEIKRICEIYLLQDKKTGIHIYGDTLVAENPGKRLKVESADIKSAMYAQTQETLMQTQGPSKPRSIVSISTLTLDGSGATFDTGTFTVNINIPEEHRTYKTFAVYRRTPDGTLHVIENVQRTPDGKEVFFSSNELGTYVLANASNIVQKGDGEKIYGSIGDIEIDGKLLTYITFGVIGLFAVFVIVIVLVAIRRKRFLAKYNRAHKGALVKRGINKIPKGNPAPASNPARPEERVSSEPVIRYKSGKKSKKLKI